MEFLRQLERILLSSEAKDAVIYAKDYTISVDDSFATVIFKDKSIIVPRNLTDQKITEIDLRHIGSILPITRPVIVTEVTAPIVTEVTSSVDETGWADIPGRYQINQKDIANKFKKILGSSIPIKKYIFQQRYKNYFKKLETNLRIEVKSADEWKLTSKFGPAKINLTSRYYQWAPNEVFIGFASCVFGDGILDKDWVQEEQLVSCLELFAHILELQEKYTHLDEIPCIIKTKAFANPKIEYYGREGLTFIERNLRKNVLVDDVEYITDVIDIYWLSMAAIDLRVRGVVRNPTINDIKKMIITAFRAFVLTGMNTEPTVINSGHWGAGVFGWKPEISTLIQYVAFSYTNLQSKGYTLRFSTAGDKELAKYTNMIEELNNLPDKSWDKIIKFIQSKC